MTPSKHPVTVAVAGSSGLVGSVVAAAFLKRGCRVLGLDLHPAEPAAAGSETVSAVEHLKVDVSDHEAVRQVLTDCLDGGPLHHLAIMIGGSLPDEDGPGGRSLPDPELFRDSIEYNLMLPYACAYGALPLLRGSTGDRSVLFCTSINAFGAWARPAYSAAKAGIGGLLRVMADRLGPEGVRVNAIAPGSVATSDGSTGREVSPGVVAELVGSVPLGHAGTADDVAAAFTAVALDLTHMNGQTLILDGGQEVRRRQY